MNGFGDHLKNLAQPLVMAGVLAIASMSVVYFVGTRVFDATMDIVFNDQDMTVTWANCIVFTIVTTVAAGLVAALLATYTDSPDKIFLIIAIVVFVLMTIPAATGDADTDTKATLLVIHVAVALSVLGILLPALRKPNAAVSAEDIRQQIRDSA